MNHRTLALGLGLIVVAALSGGCGDDGSTATAGTTSGPGSGGSSSTTTSNGPGGSGSGGSGGSTSSSGGAGGQSACEAYCTDNIATCSGNNAQWVGSDPSGFCEAACGNLTPGTDGDNSGDSLACRVTHTADASSDPAGECSASGPYGGGVCGTTQCQAFCKQLQAVCTGPNQQYASETECLTACALLPDATTPYTGDASATGNTFACRGYHLTAAAADPTTHCPHAGGQQQPCM